MGQVTFGDNIGERAILPHAGTYGHGLDYDADVELVAYEAQASEKNRPGYAKEGEGYASFTVTVVYEGKKIFLRHNEPTDPGSGSNLRAVLESVGATINDNGDGTWSHDPDEVAPKKITGVEVQEPRTYNRKSDGAEVQVSGNIVRFIA